MHTENELHDYLYRSGHNLSLAAIDYIRQSWINPSRMVGAHAQSNVVSFVPSRKLNGKTYSTESRSPERSFLTLCEFDDDVICALDQPDPIQIQQTTKNGIKRWGGYTPDALILTRNGPKVVEVKASTEVDDFLVSKAEDWKRYESGEIVFEPARKVFAELGLEHVVYMYSQEDRFLVENLDQLLLSRTHEAELVLVEERLTKLMHNAFAMTLHDLRVKLKLKDMTPLIHAIDRGLLAADLKQHRLADSRNCLVSLNEDLLDHAIELRNKQRVYWDGLSEHSDLTLIPTLEAAEKAITRLDKIKSESDALSERLL